MEQSTLAEILGVEQEIRAQLEAEREAANRWLDEQRQVIERTRAASISQLQAEAKQRREDRLRQARERAAAAVQDAVTAAEAGEVLTDERLVPIVQRHLAAILPEPEP